MLCEVVMRLGGTFRFGVMILRRQLSIILIKYCCVGADPYPGVRNQEYKDNIKSKLSLYRNLTTLWIIKAS